MNAKPGRQGANLGFVKEDNATSSALERDMYLLPFGCSSERALYLMTTVLPLASSTSISSSSSMGARNAFVGSIAVKLLYFCSQALHAQLLCQPREKGDEVPGMI